jgi:hypothetical protein
MYENWTRAEKLKWCFAWLAGTAFFGLIAVPVNYWLQHSDIEKHMAVSILISIAVPSAAVLAFVFYRYVIEPYVTEERFPDQKDTK